MTEMVGHDAPGDPPEPKDIDLTTPEARAKTCYAAVEKVLEEYRCKLAFQGKAIISSVERVGDTGGRIQVGATIDRYAFGIEPL